MLRNDNFAVIVRIRTDYRMDKRSFPGVENTVIEGLRQCSYLGTSSFSIITWVRNTEGTYNRARAGVYRVRVGMQRAMELFLRASNYGLRQCSQMGTLASHTAL